MHIESIIIFASKSKNEYIPEDIIDNLDDFYAGLEYGDVIKKEYQLWEYPSGKIFNVEADRELAGDNYYATPFGEKGTVWLPKLVAVTTDKQKVAQACMTLRSGSTDQ